MASSSRIKDSFYCRNFPAGAPDWREPLGISMGFGQQPIGASGQTQSSTGFTCASFATSANSPNTTPKTTLFRHAYSETTRLEDSRPSGNHLSNSQNPFSG